MPGYRNNVLSMINAQPLANGQYHINSMTATRKPVSYDISVQPTDQTSLFVILVNQNTGVTVSDPRRPERSQATDVKNDETKKEPERSGVYEYLKPDVEFTDSIGTQYRFFKDAECIKFSDAKDKNSSECRPKEKFVWDEKTGKGDFVPTGKYFKIETVGSSFCQKGTGFCTEMNQVIAIVSVYEDKNCTRMVDVEKIYGFKCQ